MGGDGELRIESVDLEGLRSYLAETAVTFAILFGSQARDTATESSDVDLALRFPDEMDAHDRFHSRNRIDATVQEYTAEFVDVSDIDTLPTAVAYAAVRDGIVLVGDEQAVEDYRAEIQRAYEATADEREQDQQAFIDRLARGDT